MSDQCHINEFIMKRYRLECRHNKDFDYYLADYRVYDDTGYKINHVHNGCFLMPDGCRLCLLTPAFVRDLPSG